MRHHGRLGIYFLLCSLISSSGRSNEFIPLGFLPSASGTVASNAYGVDASGQAVVGEAASNGQSVAFVWQKSSGMQPLDRTNGAYIGTPFQRMARLSSGAHELSKRSMARVF